jgi:hypothetical protein
MSDNTELPAPEGTPPDARRSHEPGASNGNSGSQDDPREALLRDVEKYRLPPELRDQILAALPPPEEMERMYREMQEKGGLSSEEFFASLGLEAEPEP